MIDMIEMVCDDLFMAVVIFDDKCGGLLYIHIFAFSQIHLQIINFPLYFVIIIICTHILQSTTDDRLTLKFLLSHDF